MKVFQTRDLNDRVAIAAMFNLLDALSRKRYFREFILVNFYSVGAYARNRYRVGKSRLRKFRTGFPRSLFSNVYM